MIPARAVDVGPAVFGDLLLLDGPPAHSPPWRHIPVSSPACLPCTWEPIWSLA